MSILRLWVIGSVLLVLLIGGLGWALGVAPKLSEAAAADDERREVELVNAGYEATLVRLRALSEELPSLQRELDELRIGIPERAEIDILLGQLNGLAEAAGVTITSVTANPPQLVDASEPESAAITDLVSIPIEVSVAGPSAGLSQFIREAQFGPRLFFVSSVDLKEDNESGQLVVSGLIYVLPESIAAVAPTEGAVDGADPAATPSPTPAP